MLFIFYYRMKNGAWEANIPKIYKYLLQDEQKPTVHEKKMK